MEDGDAVLSSFLVRTTLLSMANLIFPETPSLPVRQPTAVVMLVRREPLVAIQELLSISIHEIVNDARRKDLVADFYRLTRRIENEAWLHRRQDEVRNEAWTAAHL